jgi:hypothetical protein
LILDLRAPIVAGDLARALGLPLFEAGQRLRRGGYHLQKRDAVDQVEAERERLAAQGLRVLVVPEAGIRRAPLVVVGGGPEGEGFRFRSEEGPLEVSASDILLVVRGPITREYQAVARKRKQVATATLEDGYRIHLHRREHPRPVEIDPFSFEFAGGGPIRGSSLIEILAWLDALTGVTQDDAFRRETPALAPSADRKNPLDVAKALDTKRSSRTRRDQAPLTLDNVEQFRFYSGWRAAVERKLLESR